MRKMSLLVAALIILSSATLATAQKTVTTQKIQVGEMIYSAGSNIRYAMFDPDTLTATFFIVFGQDTWTLQPVEFTKGSKRDFAASPFCYVSGKCSIIISHIEVLDISSDGTLELTIETHERKKSPNS